MLNGFQVPIVDHFQPFWHKDFENPKRPTDNPALERHPLSIGDLIKNLKQCTYLYPGFFTKEDAFGKYYTRLPDRCANGYRRVERKNFIFFNFQCNFFETKNLQCNSTLILHSANVTRFGYRWA